MTMFVFGMLVGGIVGFVTCAMFATGSTPPPPPPNVRGPHYLDADDEDLGDWASSW